MIAEKKVPALAAAIVLIGICLINVNVCHAALSLGADTNSVDFGTVTSDDLDTGYMELTASTLTYAVRLSITDTGPVNWVLKTKADTANFSAISGTKPCGDLKWRVNGAGIYTAYTTLDTTVSTGNGNADVDVDFKLLSDWTDTPDSYSITVVFTLSEDI